MAEEEDEAGLLGARLQLKEMIKEAYEQSAADGAGINGPVAQPLTIINLANNMRAAIHEFMLQASVGTIVTLDPGQASIPNGKSIAPTMGAGAGKLL
jgi:hypothetical protein